LKFLFVHQNYPGQFLHILRHLVATKRHEIVFITEPNVNEIPGVRKVPYARPIIDIPETHIAARELDNGVRRAEAVYKTAFGLKHLGYNPDIIIGHHGWGEMLNLRDLWPDVPMLGYMEFYYQHDCADVGFDPEFPANPLDFPRIRAKNAINHIALNLGGTGQCPTQWQLSTYPDWARPRIELLWEGVDLDICSPDPGAHRKTIKVGDMTIRPGDKLITYVSRDLEPYRGFHVMMRTLPDLMRARKDLKVVIIGGDGISYGSAPHQGRHLARRHDGGSRCGHRPGSSGVSRPGFLHDLSCRAAPVRCACLSHLSVRRLLVAAGGVGDRVSGHRRRNRDGSGIHHPW
jgi:glycosyltransferase involved in cell wall biosynthesis